MKRAIVFHSDAIALNSYRHFIELSKRVIVVGSFMEVKEALKALTTLHSDIIFVGSIHSETGLLESIGTEIIRTSPHTKIFLLGLNWFKNTSTCLKHPVNGVIDLIEQRPFEIQKTIANTIEKGSDFNLACAKYPSLQNALHSYTLSIPKVDNRFWNLLPLLATNFTQQQLAQYFNCSRKTLNTLVKKYCEELNVANPTELILIAVENQWINRETVHAASERMMHFLSEPNNTQRELTHK